MLDQEGQPNEPQSLQQDRILPGAGRLSSAQYIIEVSRHLSRLRQASLAKAGRRI